MKEMGWRRVQRTARGTSFVATMAMTVAGVALAGYSSSDGHNQATLITPDPAITPNAPADYDKLCDAIECVESEYNSAIAARLTRLKGLRHICLETGPALRTQTGSASGNGRNARINITHATLCHKDLATATLLHEALHTMLDGTTPEVEHCRVWWVEYKYHRGQMEETTPGTAKHSFHSSSASAIARWYGNFEDQYNNGSHVGFPSTTPLPAAGNACRSAMASIQPPGGGTLDVMYDTWGTNKLRCRAWASSGSGGSDETVFVLPTPRITDWRLVPLASGGHAIVVVGTNPAGMQGSVCVITDEDGDFLLDTTTAAVGHGSGLAQPVAVEFVPVASGEVEWYVLDARAESVFRLVDDDGNGLPDGLGAAYASNSSVPLVADARSLVAVANLDTAGVPTGAERLALSSRIALHASEVHPADWVAPLVDSDGDGAADTAEIETGATRIRTSPTSLAGGRVGDGFILVGGVPGHPIEVRGPDSESGTHSILLGTATVQTSGSVHVQIPAFVAGDTYVLRDTVTGITSTILEAQSAGAPQVHGMSPTVGDPSDSTVVSIDGYGLPPDDAEVRVRFGDLYGTVLAASDSSLLVSTPIFGAGRNDAFEVVLESPCGDEIAIVPIMFQTVD